MAMLPATHGARLTCVVSRWTLIYARRGTTGCVQSAFGAAPPTSPGPPIADQRLAMIDGPRVASGWRPAGRLEWEDAVSPGRWRRPAGVEHNVTRRRRRDSAAH